MRPRLVWTIAFLLLAPLASGQERPPTASFGQVVPVLRKHCLGCHSGPKAKGELRLDEYGDESAVVKDRKVWEKVLRNVRSREMPPPGRPRMAEQEVQLLAGWIEAKLAQVDCSRIDLGRVTIRRLNRAEYNRTIRDLVGVQFQPADDFPADDVGYASTTSATSCRCRRF
jgi:hypothetical protein